MENMINSNSSGIIIDCVIQHLIGKPYRSAYSKAKTRYELEFIYLYDIESITEYSNYNLRIFMNKSRQPVFISYNNILLFDIPKELKGIDELKKPLQFHTCYGFKSALYVSDQFTYLYNLIINDITKKRKFHKKGDFVKIDFMKYVIIDEGYYINFNESFWFQREELKYKDPYMKPKFSHLYRLLDPLSKNLVLYDNYILNSLPVRTLVKGTSVTQVVKGNIVIFPVSNDTKYKFSNNLKLSKQELLVDRQYNINIIMVPTEKKVFMVRYSYSKELNCYHLFPLYFDAKLPIGYINAIKSKIHIDHMDPFMIHNYRFNSQYTDIRIQ